MSEQEIQKLIEKYYDAETSLEEDKILFQYYNEEDTTHIVNADRAQFLYFNNIGKEEPGLPFSIQMKSFPFSEKKRTPTNRTLFLRIAAVLILCIGIGWFLTRIQYNPSTRNITTTHLGEQTNVTLPDGSVVWLNGMTELEYGDTFGKQKREVYLKGEAYFEVVRNSSKPFVVHTEKVATEVLGTSFNLRSYSQEQNIELSVMTGKVSFGATKKIQVGQGTAASFHVTKETIGTSEASQNATAWRTKQLNFEDELMRDVVRDLERYFQTSIEIEPPGLLNCHFRGSFHDPQLEDILKVIGYSLNMEYSVRNGKYTLHGQNCAQ